MSEALRRIEAIAEANIGSLKDPIDPFLDALAKKTSIKPNRHWVTHARIGRTGARRLLIKVDLDRADTNNSTKKDVLYESISAEGMSLRTYAIGEGYTHRYASNYLVERIGENLGLSEKDIRYFLRAMRADLVFSKNSIRKEPWDFFVKVAEEYLWANTKLLRPSKRFPDIVRVDEEWDRTSAFTFYQLMYSHTEGSTRRLGGWVPYELEIMQRFYEGRINGGFSKLTPPTSFDNRVFQCTTIQDYKRLTGDVRSQTGVLVDDAVILKHRHALVYGQPSSGLFSTQ